MIVQCWHYPYMDRVGNLNKICGNCSSVVLIKEIDGCMQSMANFANSCQNAIYVRTLVHAPCMHATINRGRDKTKFPVDSLFHQYWKSSGNLEGYEGLLAMYYLLDVVLGASWIHMSTGITKFSERSCYLGLCCAIRMYVFWHQSFFFSFFPWVFGPVYAHF